jgi:putative ABC transporter-associated repeat protein
MGLSLDIVRRMRIIAGTLVAAAALALTTGTASAQRLVLSTGHIDAVAPVIDNGGLRLRVKDGTAGGPAVMRDPDAVLLHTKPDAHMSVPDGLPASFAFLGAPGSDVWLLPQIQDQDLLWAGWSSEEVPPGTFKDESLKWTLNSVQGPGPVQLFDNGPFGDPRVFFDSADGLPDTETRGVGVHAHFNWVFHRPGLYTLNFSVVGERLDGSETSAYANYQVFVGALADLPPENLYFQGLEESYDVGATATLVAKQSPVSRFSDYRWLRQCAGEDEPRQVATGATYSFTVTRADDTCRVTLSLRDDAGQELLRSYEGQVSVRSGSWGPRLILSRGHTDILEVALAGNALKVLLKDDSGDAPVLRNPQDVLLHAKPQAKFLVTDELPPEFGFLGDAGDEIYLLPEVQDPALLWPGWDTAGVPPGTVADDELTWRLLSVEGPGTLQLFTSDVFGLPRIIFNSDDGLPDTSSMRAGTHVHANWAFSRPGLYKLRFDLAGKLAADGQAIQSGPVEYYFYAGDLAALPEYPRDDPGPRGDPGETEPAPTPDPPVVTPPAVTPPAAIPAPTLAKPAERPTLRLTSARLRGRTLRLGIRLTTLSRLTVTVRRGSHLVARARARTVSASKRSLRVALNRRLAAGRYRVQVRAQANGHSAARTITLRVR